MSHAIRIHAHGGPEVMQWEAAPLPAPGPGEALVRHTAVGVNFIDTYHRSGAYPVPLPSGLGMEAAGVVEAVGPDVTDIAPGDRVVYANGPIGAYAEKRVMPAAGLVKLPDGVDDQTAASSFLRGMTARYLLRQTFPVKHGDAVLMHAAAGGVGLILCQWAKALGCTVIGTVSSRAKAELAAANGCDHVVVTGEQSFVDVCRAVTNGRGVDVVYDGVGKDTFFDSLDCLRPRGMMALFGASSGPVPPIDLQILAKKGSLFVTRPTLFSHVATRPELLENAVDFFAAVANGSVKISIGQIFHLSAAADAHRALESRATTGSTVLTV